QAEDGIRDRTVTGVQTCALPISLACARCGLPQDREQTGGDDCNLGRSRIIRGDRLLLFQKTVEKASIHIGRLKIRVAQDASKKRSEERRVGKECRSRE